jgi:hypothetical protein
MLTFQEDFTHDPYEFHGDRRELVAARVFFRRMSGKQRWTA